MVIEIVDDCVSDIRSEITTKSIDDIIDSPSIITSPTTIYDIKPTTNIDNNNFNNEVYDVRCGSLSGKLHMQKFICPGIHRQCIEFDGRFISPREFTIKAEKDKQKDWKGSIRLGKSNLRLDLKYFYDKISSNIKLFKGILVIF